ncbi:MAG TPA: hypothetical protein VKA96_03355 [Solirubrobacteraceae bacterium]|nr:hypothetical protein [Solirubrobacteraceae bacterium]
MRMRSVPWLMAIPALAVAGCGGGANQGTQAGTQSTEHKAAPTGLKQPKAKVSFVAPKDGATETDTVMAKVHVSGITLAPQAVNHPAKLGQGHLHFSMDEGKYDYAKYSGANGQLAAKLGVQGKYSPSVTPTIVYRGLPPGKHELEVYVANNDHTNAGAEAKVEFTVKQT